MSKLPLEIISLVISELEPTTNPDFDPEAFENEEATYLRDLRAVCLVWPDTIRIIRKILFRTVSLLADQHDVDTSLRNLCQALENDPSIATFVHTLELYDDSDEVPISDHPLFNSVVSFISKMDHLTNITMYGIRDFISTESIASSCASRTSWVPTCKIGMCKFSDVRAFSTFLSCWTTAGLDELEITGLSLRPDISDHELSRALRAFVNYWDDESTWVRWNMVDKPHRSSFLSLRSLEFIFAESTPRGADGLGVVEHNDALMAMDLFSSTQWSPLKALENLRVSHAFMENSLVHRVNNLIRRYQSTLKCLTLADIQNCKLVNIPFDFSSIESVTLNAAVSLNFKLVKLGYQGVNCYIKSFAVVRPDSRLKKVVFNFHMDRVEDSEYLIDDAWERLDTALSADHLGLETVDFNVYPRTVYSRIGKNLAGLRRFLLEIVFPKIAAKYFLTSGATSKLTLWEEPLDPTDE